PGQPAGTPSGPVQGGGLAGQGQAPAGDGPGEVPDGQQANQEYARRATQMALDYLEDQQDDPDPELLDKLGWTPEELRQFVERWQRLRQAAGGPEPGQKSQWDEAVRSLGLRPDQPQVRQAGSQADQVRGLSESGVRATPPPRYRELFEAYQKATARGAGSIPPRGVQRPPAGER
ncbi:MAG: hypothetical protein J5I93_18975, partial [Pirellulaceae bacterium]|nr:hypothetical protein [Pirellulaceae bacterium]